MMYVTLQTHKSIRKSSCAYFDCFSDFSHSLITGDLQQQNSHQNKLTFLFIVLHSAI